MRNRPATAGEPRGAWVIGEALDRGQAPPDRDARSAGDQARVLTFRDGYGDIACEMPRPREAAGVERDRKRMAEIVEGFGRPGTDGGPRLADLPPEVD